MKKKSPVSFVVIVLFIAAAGYLYLNAGGLLTRTVEKLASDAIGVKVEIGNISLALADKKVTVKDIRIGNPPGFKQPHALTAQQIDITLKDASRKLIDFKDISVKGSVVNLELNEHGMNVLKLKELANRKEQRETPANEEVQVIIQRMVIDATTINPSVSLFSSDTTPIKMPKVTLSGVGQGKSVSAGDAIVRLLNEYLSLIAKQAAGGGLLKDVPNADDIGNGAKDAVKSIQKLF